ncbi:hypothetical protein PHLGIDRAFT_128310 [Phlebiopsis gigantea 11061_1 CR5-6]|uniref:U3 small nucleolar RNA-associated protein 10 n=1 Tax=Phlebiopsis gigantea (strain 11061_1 CR5-6) TaxID=745531 RepID=A0A0C3PJM6_PHLG1|nr:hypothetical protein PHLGIDRAFT_128310 [Phlebiopsis gigantea 11061_1 CR5-6]
MASSLATQLAQNASLNASLLVDRSRRKPTHSYLFSSREADQHDLDSLHALAVNAFFRLKTVQPILSGYEDALFSEAAKATDRTLQNAETNAKLDESLNSFLPLLGPYLLESPTGKILEWLVRRFRVNEFNVEAILSLFLPYQESAHFTKMLSILNLSEASKFAALAPYKKTSTPLSHKALVELMLQPANDDFSRFIGSLLPGAVKSTSAAGIHRALIAFHAGTLLDFVKRSCRKRVGALEEGTLAWVLPAAIEPLQVVSTVEVESSKETLVSEVILSSYLLLSALAHTCPLSSRALSTIMKAIASCASRVSPKQLIRTLASICAAQEAENVSPLPKSVVRTVMKLPGVEDEIKCTLMFAGTENFVGPFVQGLIVRLEDSRALDVLTALVTFQSIPQIIIRSLTDSLIEQATASDSDRNTLPLGRSLLIHIQQRHPELLQAAFEAALIDAGDSKDILEQLLISLSVDLNGVVTDSGTAAETDVVVASTSAEAVVRVVAVRQLYEQLGKEGLSSIEKASVCSALLARVHDTHVPVLEELYARHEVLTPLVMENPADYVTAVAQILHSQAAHSRTTIMAHLSFIASHVYPSIHTAPNASLLKEIIFQQVLFPFLLFTKPRQRTASLVWEVIEATEKSAEGGAVLSRYELLGGCVEALRWEESLHQSSEASASEKDSYHSTEGLAKANITIAAKLAANIVASASFSSHLEFLLRTLVVDDTHAKSLAYLTCRAVLGGLSGEKQTETAHKIFTAMGLDSLDGVEDFTRGSGDLQVFLHDASLSTAVVLKPSKRATLSRLQVALLALMPIIRRPSGISLNWLDDVQDQSRGAQYTVLMRKVYSLVNSSSAFPALSSYLTTSLFMGLGEDALKFLAGIWLRSRVNSAHFEPARYSALKHAAAFMEAHFSSQRFVDFQTVLPAILVAAQNGNHRIREAALDCVAAMVRLAQAKSPIAVYAFDVIYGESSAELQYLDWSDLSRYLQALHTTRDHLINDASYLRILHQQQLLPSKGESKKESSYKQRIICYLLSHVTCCAHLPLKLSLLRSLEQVSSPAKPQVLLPVAEKMAADEELTKRDSDSEAFVSLVLASLDGSSINTLNERSGKPWATYVKIVQSFFGPGTLPSARVALAACLQGGLFKQLRTEHKVILCKVLLEQAQEHNDVATDCRALLSSLVTDTDVMVDLLLAVQPMTADAAHRAPKRAKTDSETNEAYSLLTLLAEVLGAKPLPGSLELVSCLLETLGKVVHDTSASVAEKTYVEQLLMSALDNAATNIADGASLSGANVRLDILVELIRVSENPQTFNQALLLMATLTRLAPDAVLRNVMPIFTFMGSNVFHRDDTYSFRVVQKTIDGIVPVMVNSLKSLHTDKLVLQIASRSFLRIFTDAANHIPRHRRTHFFAHLIEVLGPSDFLAPVCLLLVDKVSSKVVRQSPSDAVATLSLPLATLQRHSADLQLSALTDILHEVQRLVAPEIKVSVDSESFLESLPEEERASHTNTAKKQAHAVLLFVRYALAQIASAGTRGPTPDQNTSSALLKTLLDISASKRAKLAEASMMYISKTADDAVRDALSVMSAADFIAGALAAIETAETSILEGVFNLLAEGLPNVSERVRQESRVAITKIVDSIKTLIPTATPGVLSSALNALNTIATSLSPGEEHALTSTVPLVIKSIKERRATSSALTTLLSLTAKLGPRTIPFFKEVVKECVSVLSTPKMEGSSESIAVLQALLTSIPNFWSSADLTQVVDLYLDSVVSMRQTHSALIWTLVKSVTKKVPSKTLIPVFCEYWATLTAQSETVPAKALAYFTILKRAIHTADRSVVADNLRQLSKTFLDGLQVCASDASVRDEVGNNVIAAFLELVVKLNETTFKPLFRRVFDWAFATHTGKSLRQPSRKVVFCQVYMALLDYFKALMTPYMSFLLPPFTETLEAYSKSLEDEDLWLAMIQTVSKSLAHDEGAFWREDRLRTISSPLIAQIPVSADVQTPEARAVVSECIIVLGEAVNDDALIKKINLDVLMHTRAEDARVRLYALTCSEALWRAHGGKLMGFAGETATFVAECAEDDNDSVVREAHRLKDAIESVAGRIDV